MNITAREKKSSSGTCLCLRRNIHLCAGDYWEEGDHKATLEENPEVEVDNAPSLLRRADLWTVKESVEGLVQHTIQDEHEVSLKCLEDNSIEEVIKVEEVCSNNEYREDEHLEETEKKVGGIGNETGSQYQAANRTLPDEVLSGLRGLDGAILLLQKARLDLLRQVLVLTIFHWLFLNPRLACL